MAFRSKEFADCQVALFKKDSLLRKGYINSPACRLLLRGLIPIRQRSKLKIFDRYDLFVEGDSLCGRLHQKDGEEDKAYVEIYSYRLSEEDKRRIEELLKEEGIKYKYSQQ